MNAFLNRTAFLNRIAIVAGLLFAFASAGFAQEYNCQNPQYQQEMNHCAALEFQAADRELNKVYGGAIFVMKQIDSGQVGEYFGAENALRQAQRDWIKFRDGACKAEGFLFRGGTMEPLIISTCLTRLTQRRISDLQILEQLAY